MKRKLTKPTLSELELHAEIMNLFEQKMIVGGGSGTYQDPMTYSQWLQYGSMAAVYYCDQSGRVCWSGETGSGGSDAGSGSGSSYGYGYSSSYNSDYGSYSSGYGYGSGSYSSSSSGYGSSYYGSSGTLNSSETPLKKQSFSGTCVPTVMSWVAGILGGNWMTEGWFVGDYRSCFNKDFNTEKGISPDELDPFLRTYFDVEKLNNTPDSIRQALNTSKPVMGTLKAGVCPQSDGLHEVLINSCDASGRIVCTNPGNGKKETYSINDFQNGFFYKINSVLP